MKFYHLLRKRLLMPIASLTAILVLGAVVTQGAWGNDPESAPDSTFMAQGPIADQQTVDQSVTSKDQTEQEYEQARQNAALGPQASKSLSSYPPPVSAPQSQERTGVFENTGPLPSGWGAHYRLTNMWHDFVGGLSTVAYAGSQVDDPFYNVWNNPEQGVLVVKFTPSDPDANPDVLTYLTPTRTGRIRIDFATGTCLRLVSTGGQLYLFDVAVGWWSCDGGPVPMREQEP